MKKRFLILALAVLIPLAGLAAQENAFNFLSFNIGYGYNINTDGSGTPASVSTFGANFRVAGPMIVGFEMATPTLNLLKVKFDVIPALRAVIGYTGTDNRGLFGFEVVPFKREVSGLFTEFKMMVDYITHDNFAFTGTNSNLRMQMALGVGF